MMLLSLMSWVLAGTVYINGVRVDALPVTELKGVNIRFDAAGNIWVDAPGYKVQVMESASVASPGVTSSAMTSSTTAATAPNYAVSPGTWWLVTEDNGSYGHTVEISVNGMVVRRVRSGEPQLILDLAPYLRIGDNQVVLTALAGGQPGGGVLNIYVGKGSNQNGTIRIDSPVVRYTRRSSDSPEGGTRPYTVTVP